MSHSGHDCWNALKASRILLHLLIDAFCKEDEPLVWWASTEAIERRRGAMIKAKGIYRDPVAFFSFPLRKMQRAALDVPDADYYHCPGRQSPDTAFSYCPGSIRALLLPAS